MPKETFISRFSLIIKRLERSPATYEQIARYLQDESAIQDKDFSISLRTLQRDIKDIYNQLQIEIVNEKKGDKRYFIKSRPETQEQSQRLLESYQVINAIHAAQDFSAIVFLETRKPKGLEHFYGLLYAIKNKRIVNFQHYKYWDETITNRTVHPLALKESQGRWYLVAIDTKDNQVKTFGLDRMADIDISKTKFREIYDDNLKELFSNSFGIISPDDEELQDIVLSFDPIQGKYIKSLPLHHTQQIIIDNEDELQVKLKLYITHDFVMELLSFSDNMKVLQPTSLAHTLRDYHKKAYLQYK